MASMTASVKSRPPSWPGSVQNLYWHQGLDPSPPVNPEDIDELFAGDAAPDLQGDGEIAPYDDRVKFVEYETHPFEGSQTIKEKDGETPVDQ